MPSDVLERVEAGAQTDPWWPPLSSGEILYQLSDGLHDQLVDAQVARAREMVARLASLKMIQLSGSAFIGGVAGRLGR